MKTTHALMFFLVGLAMCFSPALWPHSFATPANAGDTSELWLLMMGVAQMALGAWIMGINCVPRMIQLFAEWEPITLNFELPDVSWALPESFYAGLGDEDEIRLAHNLQQQLRMGRA